MKYRNYKSAIHNFTHSLISIDYNISGKLAGNVLIDLLNLKKETQATINFLTGDMTPIEAKTKQSTILVKDYIEWLPIHFKSHNCDLSKIEKLETTISIAFDKATTPPGMNDTIEFTIQASTKWKAIDKEEQIVNISQNELIKKTFLKFRVPEC